MLFLMMISDLSAFWSVTIVFITLIVLKCFETCVMT